MRSTRTGARLRSPLAAQVLHSVLAAALMACGSSGGSNAPPAPDSGSQPPIDGSSPGLDAAVDSPASAGDAADGAQTDGAPSDAPAPPDAPTGDGSSMPGTLSGTLVFSASADLDAGPSELHQLYAVDLGTSQPTITPLSVTPNRGAWMPFFSHDGTQLFFTQVDQDPASPTNGQLLLVTAHPDGSSPTTITSCGASTGGTWRGPFCGWPSTGADGDIWYLLENKPPVLTFGQQLLRVSPIGGAMPTTWLDFPSDPACTIYSMALSPDGTQIAFIIGDSSACGAGHDGLYVQATSSSGLGTPVTPGPALDFTFTEPFTAFNRAGDRVYYIASSGELYSEKLDGTDSRVEVNADLSLLGSTGIGMTIVNDAYVVLSGTSGGIGAVPFASVSPGAKLFVVAPAFGAENLTWAP